MRRKIFLLLVCAVSVFVLKAQKDLSHSLVENKGQWPDAVLFASDIKGGKVFLEEDLITYHLYDLSAIAQVHDEGKSFRDEDIRIKGHVYKVKFPGCNADAITKPSGRQKAYYNYFLGNDESKWAGGCNAFEKVERKEFYEGIDFIFYTTGHTLKYDFVAHAGSDLSQIKIRIEDCDKLKIENGRLKIFTSVGIVYEQKPLAWQIIEGEKRMASCNYSLNENEVTFVFPNGYNQNYDLVIDPELVFSTYSGSFANNFGYTATYDKDGNLYGGGSTFGQGYPITTGAYQTTFNGGHSSLGGIDMGLTKYNSTGTDLIWSTYLGGNGDDLPHSLVVNDQNELFVYGTTGSSSYPVTSGAIDVSFNGGTPTATSGTGSNFPNGSDIVVTRFNQACTALVGSTYIGGSANDGLNLATALKYNYADEFRGEISLSSDGNPIIVSSTLSADFPTVNAVQPTIGGMQDGVVMKLTADLSNILWSTYIGGSGNDSGFSISENETGDVYVCGGTTSTDFLTQNNTLQTSNAGGQSDGFIVQLSSNGQSILAGTYWGSNAYDQLYFIEVDNEGFVYTFGQTRAAASEMIINAGYGTPDSGNLISKFNADLSEAVWSTVFGTGSGRPTLSPSAFLVDYCNRVYISGWGIKQVTGNALNPGQGLTSMTTMPVTADAYDSTSSSGDFYMAVFDENMTALEYATFFGGNFSSEHVDGGTSRFDRKGIIYQSVCAGCGGFDDFPFYPPNGWSAQNNNSCNNGVYKFDFQLPLTIADFEYTPLGCTDSPIQFTSTSTYVQAYSWDFGDGSTAVTANPSHSYDNPGVYTIMLAVGNVNTCNAADTVYKTIHIVEPITESLENIELCQDETVSIGLDNPNPNYQYSWSPADFLNNTHVGNPLFSAGSTTNYTLSVQREGCVDTYYQSVQVTELSLQTPADTTLCDGESIELTAIIFPSDAEIIWSDESSFGNVLNETPQTHSITVSPETPTHYYVKIISGGCELSDVVFVNLVSFQTVIQGDFIACSGDTVSLNVQDPNEGFIYHWQPEELIINGQNSPQVNIVVQESTVFTITSLTPDGCVSSDEVTVDVSGLNSGEITASATPTHIVSGQSSQLNASPEGYGYIWSPSATLNDAGIFNPLASPDETTTYYVTIFDGECVATKSVTVYVSEFVCGRPTIYVPNTFTPNEDNKNEMLYVRANQLSKLYFVIYDRWGEKVFETENLSKGWDGTFRGKKLNPDVYVYYLEATCVGGEEYFEQGNITLIR